MLSKNDYIYINFIINLGNLNLIANRDLIMQILYKKYSHEQLDEAFRNILSKTLSDKDNQTDFILGRG